MGQGHQELVLRPGRRFGGAVRRLGVSLQIRAVERERDLTRHHLGRSHVHAIVGTGRFRHREGDGAEDAVAGSQGQDEPRARAQLLEAPELIGVLRFRHEVGLGGPGDHDGPAGAEGRPHANGCLVHEGFFRLVPVRAGDAAGGAVLAEDVDGAQVAQDGDREANEPGQRAVTSERGGEQRAHLGQKGQTAFQGSSGARHTNWPVWWRAIEMPTARWRGGPSAKPRIFRHPGVERRPRFAQSREKYTA